MRCSRSCTPGSSPALPGGVVSASGVSPSAGGRVLDVASWRAGAGVAPGVVSAPVGSVLLLRLHGIASSKGLRGGATTTSRTRSRMTASGDRYSAAIAITSSRDFLWMRVRISSLLSGKTIALALYDACLESHFNQSGLDLPVFPISIHKVPRLSTLLIYSAADSNGHRSNGVKHDASRSNAADPWKHNQSSLIQKALDIR